MERALRELGPLDIDFAPPDFRYNVLPPPPTLIDRTQEGIRLGVGIESACLSLVQEFHAT